MKTCKFFISDPSAIEFDEGIDNFTSVLKGLLKNHLVKEIDIHYEDMDEYCIKREFNNKNIVMFEE